MIQVDVFWSFAMGLAFAAAAAHEWRHARTTTAMIANARQAYNLAFLGILFNPSGVYLLHRFPYWESMFMFRTINSFHPVLPTLFSSTNVLLGAMGFALTAWLANRFQHNSRAFYGIHSVWVNSYVIMFGILGFGYRRFTYAGTGAEWHQGVEYPITAFFTSPVFYTLLAMSVFILPPIFYAIVFWPRQTGMTKAHKRHHLRAILRGFVAALVAGCVGYVGYINWVADAAMRTRAHDGVLGVYAPLAGFLVANLAFFPIAAAPWLLARTAKSPGPDTATRVKLGRLPSETGEDADGKKDQ